MVTTKSSSHLSWELVLKNYANALHYPSLDSKPKIKKNMLGGEIYSYCDIIRKTKNLYFYEMF